MDYPATRDYLYSLKNRGAKYGIDRMRLFVDALGHPERNFPCIHVAGTNGKGSVCAMLESIYRAHGYKTGLYTSPHLVHQGERVQVDRHMLDADSIVEYTERLRPAAEAIAEGNPDDHPTFFEFMTAMAFLRFAEADVDIALIETGLGGRLDATNVITPELAIITSISLDHTEFLGDTLEAIATEKAGILKPGKPVLLGQIPAPAEATIRTIALQRDCPVYSVRERFTDPENDLPATNLSGIFQRWNAGIALYAAEILRDRFPMKRKTLTEALEKVDWMGRWQRIKLEDRTVILDATHNPEGRAMLDANLTQLSAETGARPIIVAGTLGEDRAQSLIPLAAGHAGALYLVCPNQPRATGTEQLARFIPEDQKELPLYHSSVDALFPSPGVCKVGQAGDTVVVTGSIYLVGEVLERLTATHPVGDDELQDLP